MFLLQTDMSLFEDDMLLFEYFTSLPMFPHGKFFVCDHGYAQTHSGLFGGRIYIYIYIFLFQHDFVFSGRDMFLFCESYSHCHHKA